MVFLWCHLGTVREFSEVARALLGCFEWLLTGPGQKSPLPVILSLNIALVPPTMQAYAIFFLPVVSM